MFDVGRRRGRDRIVQAAGERRVKAGMMEAIPRKLAAERRVVVARHHLEPRGHLVLAIPGDQRRDVRLVAGAQPDDAVERRGGDVPRHQRRDVVADATVGDADRIARQPLEHLQPRDRVGDVGLDRAVDQLERPERCGWRGHVLPPGRYAARCLCLPSKAGATSRMKRSISSFTCACGFIPTLK